MAKITSTIPTLASLDLEKSVEFYTQFLGFQKILLNSEIAIVSRDGFGIHFWKCSDKNIAENTSCYIEVDGLDELHVEFARSGTPRLVAAQLRPWGMYEMYVHDRDGNLLKFGSRVPSGNL